MTSGKKEQNSGSWVGKGPSSGNQEGKKEWVTQGGGVGNMVCKYITSL